jgi:hypothetical protein
MHIVKQRRSVVPILLLSFGLSLIAAGSASAFTTTVNSGATGYWWGGGGNVCYGASKLVTSSDAFISRTPSYPTSYQTIKMIPRLDISGDGGRTWQVFRWGYWKSVTTAPYQYATFHGEDFSNLPGHYAYRITMFFDWYVNSAHVGRVVDVFNGAGNDYLIGDATSLYAYVFNGGCYLR